MSNEKSRRDKLAEEYGHEMGDMRESFFAFKAGWDARDKDVQVLVDALTKIRDNNLSKIDCRTFADMALRDLK